MKKFTLAAASIIIALFLISWGFTGHKTIGQIAINHLTPQAKEAVKELLGDQSLADAATWADEVRNDPETREFIVSDSEKILVPDMVNNEFLTEAQKKKYRKGEEVELADGTVFNYSATDIHGIRANKIALVASVLIDGGLSYMLYKGLNALFNKRRDPVKSETLSRGYYSAFSDIEDQRPDLRNKQDQTGNRPTQRRR